MGVDFIDSSPIFISRTLWVLLLISIKALDWSWQHICSITYPSAHKVSRPRMQARLSCTHAPGTVPYRHVQARAVCSVGRVRWIGECNAWMNQLAPDMEDWMIGRRYYTHGGASSSLHAYSINTYKYIHIKIYIYIYIYTYTYMYI